jgi:glycosyltransferase involved in cell wall biosynthesis
MRTCRSETPRISVIIPTLNEERYIHNLLISLKNQSFKNFEVIVVDGGSSDRTIQETEAFCAKIVVKPKLKEFPSRNEGANVASGEILLFTGADIIMLPKTLETVLNEIEQNKLDGLCAFGRVYDAPLWGKMEYYFYYSLLQLKTIFTGDFHGSTNFMAVKKEEFVKTRGFESRIDADGFFLNAFAKNRKVKFMNGTKFVLVSGRRMKRMGFANFNFHFLYVLDSILPFIGDSRIIKLLERKSLEYRSGHDSNHLHA